MLKCKKKPDLDVMDTGFITEDLPSRFDHRLDTLIECSSAVLSDEVAAYRSTICRRSMTLEAERMYIVLFSGLVWAK
jgi:hypothetical protein